MKQGFASDLSQNVDVFGIRFFVFLWIWVGFLPFYTCRLHVQSCHLSTCWLHVQSCHLSTCWLHVLVVLESGDDGERIDDRTSVTLLRIDSGALLNGVDSAKRTPLGGDGWMDDGWLASFLESTWLLSFR